MQRVRSLIISIIGILLAAVVVSCEGRPERQTPETRFESSTDATISPPAPAALEPEHDHDHTALDPIARISIEDARHSVDQGGAVWVDVRSERQFVAGHLPGAIHVPPDRIAAWVEEAPRDRMIIIYCT